MRTQGGASEVPHGIMSHHFHDARHPKGQGSVSQEEFDAILRFVGVDRILSPGEWLERLAENALEPHHVCLTFDDALLCQFEVALPVLERYGLTAFWFVYSCVFEGHVGKLEVYRAFRMTTFADIEEFYTRFFERVSRSAFAERARAALDEGVIKRQRVCFPFYSVNDVKFRLIRDRVLGREAYERIMDAMLQEHGFDVGRVAARLWMTDEHLRVLSEQGHMIGLHSYSHPTSLATLPPREQREEYERNYAHIRRVCRRNPMVVAHPANSYGEETLDLLRGLGIQCGFRSTMAPAQPGGRLNPTPLELAREDHANVMRLL